jgi:hypothetical protein
MKHFSRVLFSGILILTAIFSNAQTTYIAHDFENCGVGLKDSSNHWVALPIYNDVELLAWSGEQVYYRVSLGNKTGVIDGSGKTVIPMIYDAIYSSKKDGNLVFVVTLNKKKGIRDTSNNIILETIYSSVSIFSDGTYAARKGNFKQYLFDADLKRTRLPLNCSSVEYLDPGLYLYNKHFLGFYGRRSRLVFWNSFAQGIINQRGDFVVKPKYRQINYCSFFDTLMRLEKKRSVTYTDIRRSFTWKYEEDGDYDQNWSSCSDLAFRGFVSVKGKKGWGLIDSEGDTLLDLVYKEVDDRITYHGEERHTIYFVETVDGKTGIYNPEQRKWLLQPLYKDPSVFGSWWSESDTSFVFLLVTAINDRYGAVMSTGEVIVPFIYKSRSGYGNHRVFMSDTNAILLQGVEGYLYPGSSRAGLVKKIPSNGEFQRVGKPGGVTLFIDPDLIEDTTLRHLYGAPPQRHTELNHQLYDSLLHATAFILRPFKTVFKMPDGSSIAYNFNPDFHITPEENDTAFFIFYQSHGKPTYATIYRPYRDDFHTYYAGGANGRPVIRDDGKRLCNYGYFAEILNGLAYFIVESKNGKNGLIDGNGKLVLDTVWRYLGWMQGNIITTRSKVKKKDASAHERGIECNLLNVFTGKLLLPKGHTSISYPKLYSESAIVEDGSGKRVFNTRLEKFVTGGLNDILALDDEGVYYVIKTCHGNMGIINHQGQPITDTIYRAINFAEYRQNQPGDQDNYVIIYNDSNYQVFDVRRGVLANSKQVKLQIIDEAGQNYFLKSGESHWNCSNCPSWIGKYDTIRQLADWQKLVLFDSLFVQVRYEPDSSGARYMHKCDACRKSYRNVYMFYGWTRGNQGNGLMQHILFASDSSLSFAKSFTSYPSSNKYEFYSNTLLFRDGPHPVLLDSLFTGNEWKLTMTKFMLAWLDSVPGIEGACSNPYMFPLMCNSRFAFSRDALLVYPPNYTLRYSQLEIPIPWETFGASLRKDVVSKVRSGG